MPNPFDTSNAYILLFNLGSELELSIADGIKIRPLVRPLSIFDLAHAGTNGFQEWAVLERLVHNCIAEIESTHDIPVTSGYDVLNRAWLASALLNLHGYTRHLAVAFNSYSWNEFTGHRETIGTPAGSTSKARPFLGHLLDFHMKTLSVSASKDAIVSAEDAEWLSAHYSKADRLAASSLTFRLAMEASNDWRFANNPRIGLARIWSGIESLFAIEAELTYRISSYGASLLEPRGASRKLRYAEIRKLYGQRSKAVHGAPMTSDQLQNALDMSFALLRDLLVRCIAAEKVPSQGDLDSALFD